MNPIQCLLNPILQTHRPYSVVKEDSNQQSRWTGKQVWINQAVSAEATARTLDGRRSTFQSESTPGISRPSIWAISLVLVSCTPLPLMVF